MGWFFFGLALGGSLGFITAALMAAAGRGEYGEGGKWW